MSQNTSQVSVKEYVVRIPKATKKKFHIMRFSADNGSDFFKNWTNSKMERENNLKEYKMAEELPKFGAGSEFGREQREEARRKRFGINVKKYNAENQPWMLQLEGKDGKKFKGIRDGGISDNVSWYVFMQGKDGAFEAYPVEEWYNFHPINRYKALSAEEAEEEFVRRDKIMNYFQIMYEKKLRKDGTDVDEEETKKKVFSKSLMLSEMDEWLSDEDDEDRESANEGNSDDEGAKSKKKKKKITLKPTKKKAGGKKRKVEGGESGDSYEEESDEYNEGAEHDYISSDSSDSDQENDEIVTKELTGVDQDDALKKLLASDDEDDEEDQDAKKEGDEEENEEGANEQEAEHGSDKNQSEKKKKKKKKKKKNKNDDGKNDEKKASDDNSDLSSDESKKIDGSQADDKKTVDELKKRVADNPFDAKPESKRMKLENSIPGSSSSGIGLPNSGDSMEEAIKKYLMRKPMTTTELLKNFMKKKDMSSEQLVTSIAEILKKVNPVKRMIKGKMYLSLKAS